MTVSWYLGSHSHVIYSFFISKIVYKTVKLNLHFLTTPSDLWSIPRILHITLLCLTLLSYPWEHPQDRWLYFYIFDGMWISLAVSWYPSLYTHIKTVYLYHWPYLHFIDWILISFTECIFILLTIISYHWVYLHFIDWILISLTGVSWLYSHIIEWVYLHFVDWILISLTECISVLLTEFSYHWLNVSSFYWLNSHIIDWVYIFILLTEFSYHWLSVSLFYWLNSHIIDWMYLYFIDWILISLTEYISLFYWLNSHIIDFVYLHFIDWMYLHNIDCIWLPFTLSSCQSD